MNNLDDIKMRSASTSEFVFDYHDAMEVLYIFERDGTKVLGWEGWLKYSDGKLGHSSRHQGTVDLSTLSTKAAIALVKNTIMQSYNEWNELPEVGNAELLFCITTNT